MAGFPEPARKGIDIQSVSINRGLTLIYDGDCPLCSAYITRLRLTRAAGPVNLINARDHPELVAHLSASGYPLDDGMVVRIGERHYFGAEAIHVLALMSSRVGCFNRINFLIFHHAPLSRLLYPLLVRGRKVLLWLLGRTPLGTP